MIKIISLGVGRQSTAIYLMSSMGEMERADFAVFADTGGEKTATLEYLEWLLKWKDKNNGIPIHVANYKDLQTDLLNGSNSRNNKFAAIPAFTETDGKVGMLRRQCTGEYKIAQVNKKVREVLGIGNKNFPICEMWQGITIDEMTRMSIPQEKWKINYYPYCGYKVYPNGNSERTSDENKTLNDLLNWYKSKNITPPWKSSCKFCPFQTDRNWLRLKREYPKDFADAVSVDKAIRDSSKKGSKSPIYLHSSLQPLDQVKFDENQLSIWGNCMDGCEI